MRHAHSIDDLVQMVSAAVSTLSNPTFVFVADIGATNCRLGFVPLRSVKGHLTPSVNETIVLKQSANSVEALINLTNAVSHALSQKLKNGSIRIVAAAVDGPGPAVNHCIGPVANFVGDNRIVNIPRDFTATLFPKGVTGVLNDLEAVGHGILQCNRQSVLSSFFDLYLPSSTMPDRNNNTTLCPRGFYVVVAPGTGLGVAMIYNDALNGSTGVLPLEFGHNLVATNAWQSLPDLCTFLQEGLATEKRTLLEWDDVVSGRGLVAAYAFYAGRRGGVSRSDKTLLSAAEIATKALSGECETCVRAMTSHYELMFHFASEMVSGFVAVGAILCGDNIVNNLPFLQRPSVAAHLKRVFHSHPMDRYHFQSNSVVLVQTKKVNMNLLGCIGVAATLADGKTDDALQVSRL
eukprot:PhM_4_TR14282/c0_g1_i1/m.86266/K00845/glk; glucokinase